jgi:putative DNA primase/helicase
VNPLTGKNALVIDLSSWGTFDQALSYIQEQKGRGIAGIGFVFTNNDPFIGIDLDHCRDPETGQIAPWAMKIVDKLNSYTEISPSGNGLHIIVVEVLPPGLRKKGDMEMYDAAHYFTITGQLLPGINQTIASRQPELNAIHARYLGDYCSALFPKGVGPSNRPQKVRPATRGWRALPQFLPDAELTPADLEIIRRLRSGQYGELYLLLFICDLESAGCLREGGPYRSPSEADLALLNLLARLTDGNPTRMWAIFQHTGLIPGKVTEHPSYLARTI